MAFKLKAAQRLKAAQLSQLDEAKKLGLDHAVMSAARVLAPRANMLQSDLIEKVDLKLSSNKKVTFVITSQEAAAAEKFLKDEIGKGGKTKTGVQWRVGGASVTLDKHPTGYLYSYEI